MTTPSTLAPPRPRQPVVARELLVFVLDASRPELAPELARAVADVAARRQAGWIGGNVLTSSVVFDTRVLAVTEPGTALTEARVYGELRLGVTGGRFIGAGFAMAHMLAAWHLDRWDDGLPLSVTVLAAVAGPCVNLAETVVAYGNLTADPRVTASVASLTGDEVEFYSTARGRAPSVPGDQLARHWLRASAETSARRRESGLLG